MSDTQPVSTPNVTNAAPAQNAATSLDAIAAKMTAMRNQLAQSTVAETGSSDTAKAEAPVAPEGIENDTSQVEPEVDSQESQDSQDSVESSEAPADEQVSPADTTAEEIIDFLEFTQENPNAKFKFMRNGKEMVIDAKRAAAILGQGGAIHEEARELKVQKAEFDEYLKRKTAEAEGLTLALEFTVRPQIQQAYDEIVKTQGYQTTFQQQLQQARARGDVAAEARITASMQQNEAWIRQQSALIQQLKPNIEQFYQMRGQQVASVLENNRKSFKDKELRNEYVYNELRDKVSKDWAAAKNQLIPGVNNIDLISSDEHILGLIRDGLKFRERPQTKAVGSSIAALTSKKSNPVATAKTQAQTNLQQLQEQANKGDRKAQDNLLMAKLQAIRGQRR